MPHVILKKSPEPRITWNDMYVGDVVQVLLSNSASHVMALVIDEGEMRLAELATGLTYSEAEVAEILCRIPGSLATITVSC